MSIIAAKFSISTIIEDIECGVHLVESSDGVNISYIKDSVSLYSRDISSEDELLRFAYTPPSSSEINMEIDGAEDIAYFSVKNPYITELNLGDFGSLNTLDVRAIIDDSVIDSAIVSFWDAFGESVSLISLNGVLFFPRQYVPSDEVGLIVNDLQTSYGWKVLYISSNILDNCPNVYYPNGGEILSSDNLTIEWTEALNISEFTGVRYEIFITDSYSYDEEFSFLKIAEVPQGVNSYTYNIDKSLRGKSCRIGIRSVGLNGMKSLISWSAFNFDIIHVSIPAPSMIKPLDNTSYFSFVPFEFDNTEIIREGFLQSYYQIYARAESLGIEWFLLKTEIVIDSDINHQILKIDTDAFIAADDYEFKVELVSNDAISIPVFINNVKINNLNYFLIDTIPPVGSIKILNNEEYTNQRELMLSLEAYDELSGVKDYKILQTNLFPSGLDTDEDEVIEGVYQDFSSVAGWLIPDTSSDGAKLMQVSFRDNAGNEVSVDSLNSGQKFFRTYKNIDNQRVSAFIKNGQDVYYSFIAENSGIITCSLYKNTSFIVSLSYEISSMVFYNSILYIALKDEENKGLLKRKNGAIIESVRDNGDMMVGYDEDIFNLLYETDSVINTMTIFDDKLFMGLQNGKLLSYDGNSIETVNSTYFNEKNINKIYTDNNLLYIFLNNSKTLLIMFEDEGGEYVFTEKNMEKGL